MNNVNTNSLIGLWCITKQRHVCVCVGVSMGLYICHMTPIHAVWVLLRIVRYCHEKRYYPGLSGVVQGSPVSPRVGRHCPGSPIAVLPRIVRCRTGSPCIAQGRPALSWVSRYYPRSPDIDQGRSVLPRVVR